MARRRSATSILVRSPVIGPPIGRVKGFHARPEGLVETLSVDTIQSSWRGQSSSCMGSAFLRSRIMLLFLSGNARHSSLPNLLLDFFTLVREQLEVCGYVGRIHIEIDGDPLVPRVQPAPQGEPGVVRC